MLLKIGVFYGLFGRKIIFMDFPFQPFAKPGNLIVSRLIVLDRSGTVSMPRGQVGAQSTG